MSRPEYCLALSSSSYARTWGKGKIVLLSLLPLFCTTSLLLWGMSTLLTLSWWHLPLVAYGMLLPTAWLMQHAHTVWHTLARLPCD